MPYVSIYIHLCLSLFPSFREGTKRGVGDRSFPPRFSEGDRYGVQDANMSQVERYIHTSPQKVALPSSTVCACSKTYHVLFPRYQSHLPPSLPSTTKETRRTPCLSSANEGRKEGAPNTKKERREFSLTAKVRNARPLLPSFLPSSLSPPSPPSSLLAGPCPSFASLLLITANQRLPQSTTGRGRRRKRRLPRDNRPGENREEESETRLREEGRRGGEGRKEGERKERGIAAGGGQS